MDIQQHTLSGSSQREKTRRESVCSVHHWKRWKRQQCQNYSGSFTRTGQRGKSSYRLHAQMGTGETRGFSRACFIHGTRLFRFKKHLSQHWKKDLWQVLESIEYRRRKAKKRTWHGSSGFFRHVSPLSEKTLRDRQGCLQRNHHFRPRTATILGNHVKHRHAHHVSSCFRQKQNITIL